MQKVVMALAVATVMQVGCSQTGSSSVVVTPSSVIVVDDADAVAWEGGFLWVAAEPIDPTLTVDVTAAAQSVAAAFTPAGCANTMTSANVVLLQMTNCSGPFGINRVTGSVTFLFTEQSNGAQIAATATKLQIGGGNLTISATGVLTTVGNARTLTVNTNGGGIGPNGSSVEREGQYMITWNAGDTCATVNGAVSAGTVNEETTSFGGLVLCTPGCPRSGTIPASDPSTGSTFTTTYDGTASATVVGSNGTQSVVALSCGDE